jgi:hypothetical protein
MFNIIKTIIWIVGTVVVLIFVLNYFGYEINTNYFNESRKKCEQRLENCRNELIHQGLDNAKCSFECVNPSLIIRKK